jgi:integrase
MQDLKNGAASSTIHGHLYGLTQIWKRAKLSKLVTGENPFGGHGVKKRQISYDPFTLAEIYQLHRAANASLKTLIHAAATTGARLNELLTAEVKTPSTFDKPCWLFKFKDRGKTEQSTRVVSIHPSLSLPEGFTFRGLSDRTVTRQFKEIRESCMNETFHELTGKPRKLSSHSFRTTVVTALTVTHRINEKVVGTITGHLAGNAKVGSIRSYINPDDLHILLDVVSLLPWNPKSATDPVKGEA